MTENKNQISPVLNNQSDLVKIRDGAPTDTETYQRAKDRVRDIQLDTINKQTGSFADFVKEYKSQADKLNRNVLILTIIIVVIGVLGLVVQIVDLSLSSSPKVEVIKIDTGR